MGMFQYPRSVVPSMRKFTYTSPWSLSPPVRSDNRLAIGVLDRAGEPHCRHLFQGYPRQRAAFFETQFLPGARYPQPFHIKGHAILGDHHAGGDRRGRRLHRLGIAGGQGQEAAGKNAPATPGLSVQQEYGRLSSSYHLRHGLEPVKTPDADGGMMPPSCYISQNALPQRNFFLGGRAKPGAFLEYSRRENVRPQVGRTRGCAPSDRGLFLLFCAQAGIKPLFSPRNSISRSRRWPGKPSTPGEKR